MRRHLVSPEGIKMAEQLSQRARLQMAKSSRLTRRDTQPGFRIGEVSIDSTWLMPNEHPTAMEPHATLAVWSDEMLTVYNSTQWVMGDQNALAAAFRPSLTAHHHSANAHEQRTLRSGHGPGTCCIAATCEWLLQVRTERCGRKGDGSVRLSARVRRSAVRSGCLR